VVSCVHPRREGRTETENIWEKINKGRRILNELHNLYFSTSFLRGGGELKIQEDETGGNVHAKSKEQTLTTSTEH
jgi:hypothetical protein